MPLQRVPNADDFNAYRVTSPNFAEVVRQPLYDYQLYNGTGHQQLNFFQIPVGQGVTTALGATVGQPKTLADTNMQLGGQLPSGVQFLAESLEVNFFPGSVATANTYTPATLTFFAAVAAATVGGALNDVNTFYQSGVLELNVLAKNFLRDQPLLKFVPQVTFDVSGTLASNSATTSEVGFGVAKPDGDPYWLEPPIALLPAVAFSVTLNWPNVVALPSGFNARIGITLQGFTYRAGQ